jgi:hypothetical protein
MSGTSVESPLPTFVIGGTMRAGTTSLTRWLRRHPDVLMASDKELHYFDSGWEHGETIDDYRRQFVRWSGERAVGEATPNYLFHREAMARLASVLPDVRIVLSLRNPIDRAYSQYWARRSRQVEKREFDEVVRTEPDVIVGDDGYVVARGQYHEQIQRMLEHIPREQVLVVLFEDVEGEPEATYSEVCRFIGVDDGVVPAEVGQAANAYRHFRSQRVRRVAQKLPKPAANLVGRFNSRVESYPPMDASTRSWLVERYRPHNAALGEWLDRDLTTWDA